MLADRDSNRLTFAPLKNTLVNPPPESETSGAKLLEHKEFDAISKVEE